MQFCEKGDTNHACFLSKLNSVKSGWNPKDINVKGPIGKWVPKSTFRTVHLLFLI